MKKILGILCIASILIISSCANTENKSSTSSDTTAVSDTTATTGIYQCPMKCEGEKTYTEAGKCPVCGMDLEKI